MTRRDFMPRGFTLIELLIVVAIIAILAAIAIPNFLEAQVRSKVSRVKADLRTYALGMEAYAVDNNQKYPIWLQDGKKGNWHYDAMLALIPLTTPVAYMTTSELTDPFSSIGRIQGAKPPYDNDYAYAYYKWTGAGAKSYPACTFGDYWQGVPDLNTAVVWSLGPGASKDAWMVPEWGLQMMLVDKTPQRAYDQFYDPTNGTVSFGGIARYVGDTCGYNFGR